MSEKLYSLGDVQHDWFGVLQLYWQCTAMYMQQPTRRHARSTWPKHTPTAIRQYCVVGPHIEATIHHVDTHVHTHVYTRAYTHVYTHAHTYVYTHVFAHYGVVGPHIEPISAIDTLGVWHLQRTRAWADWAPSVTGATGRDPGKPGLVRAPCVAAPPLPCGVSRRGREPRRATRTPATMATGPRNTLPGPPCVRGGPAWQLH